LWSSLTSNEPSFITITSAGRPRNWLFSTKPVRKGSTRDMPPLPSGKATTTSAAYFCVRFHGPWRAMKIAPWYFAGNILPL